MAEDLFSVTVEGTEDLKRRLGDPELVNSGLRVVGARAARAGKRTAIQAINGGTGEASKSIVSQVWPAEGMALIKTRIPLARAISIEHGRLPGDPPSLGSMINWVEATGHPQDAAVVRGEIAARGARGKNFLGQVLEVWQSSMGRWLDEAAKRIEKKFNKQ